MRNSTLAILVIALFALLAPPADAQGYLPQVAGNGQTQSGQTIHAVTMEFRDDDGDGKADRVRVRDALEGGWGEWMYPREHDPATDWWLPTPSGAQDWYPPAPVIGPPSLEALRTWKNMSGDQDYYGYRLPHGTDHSTGTTDPDIDDYYKKRIHPFVIDPTLMPGPGPHAIPPGKVAPGNGGKFGFLIKAVKQVMQAQGPQGSAEKKGRCLENGVIDNNAATIEYTSNGDGGSALDEATVDIGGGPGGPMIGQPMAGNPGKRIFLPPPPPGGTGPAEFRHLIIEEVEVNGKPAIRWVYYENDGTQHGGLGNGQQGNPLGWHDQIRPGDFVKTPDRVLSINGSRPNPPARAWWLPAAARKP